jgi:anti-sigma B factor antagonist
MNAPSATDIEAAPGWAAPEELIIATAATERERWLQVLAANPAPELSLDLSAVTELDSAGIQLMAATRRHLAEEGRSLQLLRPSAAVRHGLTSFGLGHWLA